MRKKKKVSVIGLGYVGLPTMVAIDKTGLYETVGFNKGKQKIDLILSGKSPIKDELVEKYLERKKLKVSEEEKILEETDIFIICVPTPVYDDYTPNYSFVLSAVKTASAFLRKGGHIILESTVNPGTCREIILPKLERWTSLSASKDYNLAHCPERINPGDKKWNIYNIPRNIGSIDKKLNKEAADFYRSFIKAEINEVSSLEIAEATKVVENTFRDINIAYVNELAKSFDVIGIDLYETIRAASNKPFGFMAHWPGCGVGGHCIAVDPYYLIDRAAKSGFAHRFLSMAREINNSMPEYTVQKLIFELNKLGIAPRKTNVTLLGLAYKPDVGDTRESPALEIKKLLEKLGVNLITYDPYVESDSKSLAEAIKGATAVVIATAHQEFREKLIKLLPKTKVKLVIDGRNCLKKDKIEKIKIIYKGIGR